MKATHGDRGFAENGAIGVPQPWSWMGGPNGFIIDAHGAPRASTSVNQGRGPAHFSSAAAMMGAAVRGDGAYVSDAHAFYEPTPFCAPMTRARSRILLDSVNVKGNVVARSRSKADCRSSRRSSRTLRSKSLSSLLSLLRQRQMSFRTFRISFNRSSIEAITDTISNLNQPWTTGQSRRSLGKTPMRSHDVAICGHDVKISYQHVLLYRSLFNARARSDNCFCRSSAIFAISAQDFKSCHSAVSGSKWFLSQPTGGPIRCQAGT